MSCFPWKTHTKKSMDPPWITEDVKKLVRRRKRCYKKNKRTHKWRDLKRRSDELITKNKRDFLKKATERLIANESNQVPYKALKEIAVPERPKAWTINDVSPDLNDAELAKKLAAYFSLITDKFEPIVPYENNDP